ncbi:hypothetical protein HB852_09610 [Listeria grandensis]|uniref:Uncharacterized protein n=1 Tax=Listeria grandensis TaxID=1494963 RepID=A0A7X0Y4M6_9LIST|nr:hypothetical protein [Listeria grandensis]MBC1474872.1 hypothetical protein [Listeria grandensis]MBC1936927.1 hypothetical protein [Listeria grandensis]MBC6316598.1 hypothetical protein [Listeria grandensis]
MTRKKTPHTIPPTLDRITVVSEADILQKLRESQADVQQGATMSSATGWAQFDFNNELN